MVKIVAPLPNNRLAMALDGHHIGGWLVEIVPPDGVTYCIDAASYQPQEIEEWAALASHRRGPTSAPTKTATGAPGGAGAKMARQP